MKPQEKPGPPRKSKILKSSPATPIAAAAKSPTRKSASRTANRKRRPASQQAATRTPPVPIPPLLLENDASPTPQPSGPGMRYALGPQPPSPRPDRPTTRGDLPEAYGTQRLLLTARDPHWLYAHWDLTEAQLRHYNTLSADRHLIVRIYRDQLGHLPEAEVHVHPESRNWFVHVGSSGARYIAELGYYTDPARRWVRISTSGPTFTPPDDLSADLSVQFTTIPADIALEQLASVLRTAVADHVPLAEAILQLRASGMKGLPQPEAFASGSWTSEQQRALASVISLDELRRVWIGSLEVTELVRRQLARQISSAAAAQIAPQQPAIEAIGSLASPYGGIEERKGFWFNINAELIVYGSTEPNASVTIGERPIQLRPDGSFSYRFALPDGDYQLPATATAAHGQDSRTADLRFSRQTFYRGHVAAHPQKPSLKPPHPDHLA